MAQPQHFDISGTLPPELRPQNFHELEAQKFEIIQYLVNTQGLSRGEANMVISNLEVDLMNTASLCDGNYFFSSKVNKEWKLWVPSMPRLWFPA